MSESPEIQTARLEERLKAIQEILNENRMDTKELYDKVEQVLTMLGNIESRVKILEKQIEEHSPMFDEFTQLKHEVAGAKRVMRWIWFTLSGLAAFAIYIRDEIFDLFK